MDELLAAMQPDACLVVLLCGMAGAGKTTFSQRLEARGFTRLSIDETMWHRFGRYGIDYPAPDYRSLLDLAHAELHDRQTARSPSRLRSSSRSSIGSLGQPSSDRDTA